MQTKNLLPIGDFNAPNVNWNDMTTSCHDATFDARILSLCLDNFLDNTLCGPLARFQVNERPVLTLCLRKRPKIYYLLTGANHWETAIMFLVH